MKIIGIGTDIVEIARLEQVLARHAARFTERILHPDEQARFVAHPQQAKWLAKRFATKEAVAKALGTGIGKQAHFSDIETLHDARGKPLLRLHGVTLATATELGVTSMELSVSDERTHAVAFVVLVGE